MHSSDPAIRPDVANTAPPAPRPLAAHEGRTQRIIAEGRVALGRELKLKQSPAPVETTASGHQIKQLIGERIDYRLAPSSGNPETTIENDGLVTGFGIFGAPGTGKTHLLLHILRQLLEGVPPDGDPNRKFGGLILDPKAALLADLTRMWRELAPHRAADLVVLKPDFLNTLSARDALGRTIEPASDGPFAGISIPVGHPRALNVIDCALTPSELGRMLVLAAQSAGVSAREPFWFLAWTNLFSAALTLLEYREDYVPTISLLLDELFTSQPVPGAAAGKRERRIQALARAAREKPESLVEKGRRLGLSADQVTSDLAAAAAQVDSFFQSNYVHTIEAFITNAFGAFQQSKFQCLSRGARRWSEKYGLAAGAPCLYDQILEEGKVVLVSIGPQDPGIGKMLCTLVKCLFQQSVMSRLERYTAGQLRNFTRPVFIACDEYAEVASEIPGQPVGDGRFFSLSRQNGCMGLLATQSIHMLENSSLSESWKSIFSNLGAKIFMGAADNETAEQACALAGQNDWEVTSTTESYGRDSSRSHQRSFQQRPELTPYVLTHVLKRGEAVSIGSLDGRKTPPALRFFQVPPATQQRSRRCAKDDLAVPH